jgi:hypothetical protein
MSSPAGWSTSWLSKAALSAFACLLVLVAACGGSDDDNKGIAISTQAPSTPATPDTRTPIAVPPVSPTAAAPAPVVGGEPTAFQTADGAVTIRGTLFSAAGPKRRVVIIASQAPDTEAAWQPFAKELAGAGIAALTFQMPQYKDMGGQRDYALMDRDLESAVLLLESRDYPLIYVLGDTTAGTAALKLAARHKLSGVITVAAPFNFGIATNAMYDARPDLAKITAPKLFIASSDRSADVQELMKAPDPKQSKLVAGPPCCGIVLLNGTDGAALKQTIREFLLK